MAAAIWRRSFSTSPVAPASLARRRNERAIGGTIVIFAAPGRRDGVAPLVPAQFVVAARARPDLLAGRADVDVGLSAKLRIAELRLLHACSRHVHRRGDAVGHPVSRSARFLD